MKRIRYLSDPPCGLATYRELDGGTANWDRFRSHEAGAAYSVLRRALVDLQHGLCGYCEVGLIDLNVQVEHVIPQGTPRIGHQRDLDPVNMMACCLGGTKSVDDEDYYLPPVRNNSSCGQAKGGETDGRFVDPRTLPALPSLVQVRATGEIEADLNACTDRGVPVEHVRYTIRMLGLNVRRLIRTRRKRWSDLNTMFGNLDDPNLITGAAQQELGLDGHGSLPAFFTTARSFFGAAAEAVLGEFPQVWI